MNQNKINNVLEKRQKGIKLNKKQVRELAIKFANIHLYSKKFAKNELELFAGQKNFSGRNLKYIYNSVNIRNYDLCESIISVIEDCYSNSYKKPDDLKKILIKKYLEKPENFNETMDYLRRDEDDIDKKYEQLILIIDEYTNKQTPFNFTKFLEHLDRILLKDIKEILDKINEYLIILDNNNINGD